MEIDGGSSAPANWHTGGWGTNTVQFTYPGEAEDGVRGASVAMTGFTTGDAKWYFDDVNVTPGLLYQFSDYYKSTGPTQILVRYAALTGTGTTYTYAYLGAPADTTTWQQFVSTFTPPAGTVSATIFHLLYGVGSLTVDNFSLTLGGGSSSSTSSASSTSTSASSVSSSVSSTSSSSMSTSSSSNSTSSVSSTSSSSSHSTSSTFDKGYVTLTFDDGLISQYTNVLPMLHAAGLKASFYIITGPNGSGSPDAGDTTDPQANMSWLQIHALATDGQEVSAHTRSHPSLTIHTVANGGTTNTNILTTAEKISEIQGSRDDLIAQGFSPVDTFVYPYGDYDATAIQLVQNAGFVGARSVDDGYNTPLSNKYALQVQNVLNTTTAAQMEQWINLAVQNHTWLILVIHHVDATNDEYGTTPDTLQTVVNYLKQQNTPVITMKQGLQMMP